MEVSTPSKPSYSNACTIKGIQASKIAVIILNYNGKRHLGRLLDDAIESALNQTYANFEVIFADNGSDDDSVDYVKNKYGNRTKVVAFGKNYGFCLGNNLASQHVSANTKYLLFLNPDAVLSKNYCQELIKILENDEKIGIIQGLQRLDERLALVGGFLDSLGKPKFGIVAFSNGMQSSTTYPVLWVFGSAMVIRRNLFQEIRGFSPELFMYFDEADLCIRTLCRRYKCLSATKTSYYHLGGGITSKVNLFGWYFIVRNRWILVLRYFPLMNIMKVGTFSALELFFNTAKSFSSDERNRPRLMIKAIYSVLKNLKRELGIRRTYSPYRDNYMCFIVKKHSLRGVRR
jgi:hypothetical protein